jgi:hypothetical protein
MDGYTLEKFVRNDNHAAPIFDGVYASDTLPYKLHCKPTLIIVNTDPISKPGTHWQAIAIDTHRNGEFFCSFGLPPYVPQIRKFLDRHCKAWKHNTVDVQALDSTVCGQYCAMFLLFKAHGYSMNDFVGLNFSNDCHRNDQLVSQMFQRYGGNVVLCDDIRCKKTQTCSRRRKHV